MPVDFALQLINFVRFVVNVFMIAVFARALMSWFMSPFHPISRFLDKFIEPLSAPIRRFLPNMGGIDIAPLILLLIAKVAEKVLTQIIIYLFL